MSQTQRTLQVSHMSVVVVVVGIVFVVVVVVIIVVVIIIDSLLYSFLSSTYSCGQPLLVSIYSYV